MIELDPDSILDDLLQQLDDPSASELTTAKLAAQGAYSIFLHTFTDPPDAISGRMAIAGCRLLLARLTYLGLQAHTTLAGRALRCGAGHA